MNIMIWENSARKEKTLDGPSLLLFSDNINFHDVPGLLVVVVKHVDFMTMVNVHL